MVTILIVTPNQISILMQTFLGFLLGDTLSTYKLRICVPWIVDMIGGIQLNGLLQLSMFERG